MAKGRYFGFFLKGFLKSFGTHKLWTHLCLVGVGEPGYYRGGREGGRWGEEAENDFHVCRLSHLDVSHPACLMGRGPKKAVSWWF